jgi:hypothetical protein
MNKSLYLTNLTDEELLYYTSNSGNPPSKVTVNWKQLSKDIESGVVTPDEVKELIGQLDYGTLKDTYNKVLNNVDPLDPEESYLDLLDILDPYETYFK